MLRLSVNRVPHDPARVRCTLCSASGQQERPTRARCTSNAFCKAETALPGSFSFRVWSCTTGGKRVKGFVLRGALLPRHAPHEPKPFLTVGHHDSTASAPQRGFRRDSRLSLRSGQTPSLARHALAGLLCDVVWLSQL